VDVIFGPGFPAGLPMARAGILPPAIAGCARPEPSRGVPALSGFGKIFRKMKSVRLLLCAASVAAVLCGCESDPVIPAQPAPRPVKPVAVAPKPVRQAATALAPAKPVAHAPGSVKPAALAPNSVRQVAAASAPLKQAPLAPSPLRPAAAAPNPVRLAAAPAAPVGQAALAPASMKPVASMQTAVAAPPGSPNQKAADDWAVQMLNAFNRKWRQPYQINHHLATSVGVKINSTGGVQLASVRTSSGDPAFDTSVVQAIYRSSPLP
jgi:TonB family protein